MWRLKVAVERFVSKDGYAGEYTDLETNTYSLRNRYYSPNNGRFLTEDPIRDGLNWYTYAGNNPTMFIDPLGLKKITIVAGGDVRSSHNAFNDNANTWISDNMTSEDEVVIVDVGNNKLVYVDMDVNGNITRNICDYKYDDVSDVFGGIKFSFADNIDELIFETHSSPNAMYLRSDIVASKEEVASYFDIPENEFRSGHGYYMDKYINMGYEAVIRFNGCNTGGMDGTVMKNSMAQLVANAADVPVYAFVNNTTQMKKNGRTFQYPV